MSEKDVVEAGAPRSAIWRRQGEVRTQNLEPSREVQRSRLFIAREVPRP